MQRNPNGCGLRALCVGVSLGVGLGVGGGVRRDLKREHYTFLSSSFVFSFPGMGKPRKKSATLRFTVGTPLRLTNQTPGAKMRGFHREVGVRALKSSNFGQTLDLVFLFSFFG